MKIAIVAALLAAAASPASSSAQQGRTVDSLRATVPTAPDGAQAPVTPLQIAPQQAAVPALWGGTAVPGTAVAAPQPEPAPIHTPTADQLAKLGTGTAPSSIDHGKWSDLGDSSRYLLIMGTADGFSASGPGAPCFPGQDNSKMAASLQAAGFADQDPAKLPEALKKLSGDKTVCANGSAGRGYTNQLLKTMPDQDLATYITGAVRGYADVTGCSADRYGPAAVAVATAIFKSEDGLSPVQVMAPALAEACTSK